MKEYSIVIIGGGPAGLSAAIEARKQGIKDILVVERDRELGGILQQCIHNGFGVHEFGEELTGPEYAERFIRELKRLGVDYWLDTMVLDIDIAESEDRNNTNNKNKIVSMINSEKGFINIKTKSVILAMGCRERTRDAIRIPGTRPSGVFTAGTVQRFINIDGYMVGRKVFILGSGDIGLIMARRLTLEGAEVIGVAEIMPYSSGLNRNIVQCLNDFNIPLMLNHTVIDVKGKDRAEGVVVAKVDDSRQIIKGTEKMYQCDTLVLSVGLIPENELSRKAEVELSDITGGPVVNQLMETSIDGIFACGNVVHVHDLVDYVSEESRVAGRNAARYVKGEIRYSNSPVKIVAGKGISYAIPNSISMENLDDFTNIYMRLDNKYRNIKIIVKSIDTNDKATIIKEIKKNQGLPGEMTKTKISKEQLQKNQPTLFEIEIREEAIGNG